MGAVVLTADTGRTESLFTEFVSCPAHGIQRIEIDLMYHSMDDETAALTNKCHTSSTTTFGDVGASPNRVRDGSFPLGASLNVNASEHETWVGPLACSSSPSAMRGVWNRQTHGPQPFAAVAVGAAASRST